MNKITLKSIFRGAMGLLLIGAVGCEKDTTDYNEFNYYKEYPLKELSNEAKEVRDYVKKDIIIAHRGSTFWTPEETEASYRWARNIGADYLELDLQRTKDGFLMALHDNNLRRTSNIESVFPGREDLPVSEFTLAELRQLDAGSWFNYENPENAREGFANQKVCTLEEVLKIAEGYRIKRDVNGDPVKLNDGPNWTGIYEMEIDSQDNGNRPGVYVETKAPYLFPNVELDLATFLAEQGWNINVSQSLKSETVEAGKVDVAYTKGRVILQSFSVQSIAVLDMVLPKVPKCMLLWQGNSGAEVHKENQMESLAELINFSVEHNCHIAGPSIAGNPNNYDELTAPWMNEMYHRAGMLVHAYSFDTEDQLKKYNGDYYYDQVSRFQDPNREIVGKYNYEVGPNMFIDGGFTNLTDLSINYYNPNDTKVSAKDVLTNLGY